MRCSLHQLGTATSTMNFLRQLGSSLLVAVFGAILLGVGGSSSAELAGGAQMELAFFWIFVAASLGFALAFIFIVLMKEQPLRSAARHAAEAVTVD